MTKTPVIYVKDNSTADAETDASLVDVPLRCTEEVADAPDVVASAPNSADACRMICRKILRI